MKRLMKIVSIFAVASILLAACAQPTPEVIEKEVQVEVTKVVEKVVTATPEPLPEGAKMILRVGTGDSRKAEWMQPAKR